MDHNAPCLPPKFFLTIFYEFSWDDSNSQEKLEAMVMKYLGGGGVIKVHYGLSENVEYAKIWKKQFSEILSHYPHWENKTYKLKRSINPYVYLQNYSWTSNEDKMIEFSQPSRLCAHSVWNNSVWN